jgi:D-sedoheptulose 7-phosphate isomerase
MNAHEQLWEAERVLHFVRDRVPAIAAIAEVVASALGGGHRLLARGNGGSALQAQHLATELVGRFRTDRSPMPALALTADAGVVTAIANDYGYDRVFARQVAGIGRPGDVLVAFSTSGRSTNLLAAVETAAERGLATVGFSGRDGSSLASLADHALVLPFEDTARIQEGHLLLLHLLAGEVDAAFTRPE